MILDIVGIVRWRIVRKKDLEAVFSAPKVSLGFCSKPKFYLGVVHFIELLIGLVENASPASSSLHA